MCGDDFKLSPRPYTALDSQGQRRWTRHDRIAYRVKKEKNLPLSPTSQRYICICFLHSFPSSNIPPVTNRWWMRTICWRPFFKTPEPYFLSLKQTGWTNGTQPIWITKAPKTKRYLRRHSSALSSFLADMTYNGSCRRTHDDLVWNYDNKMEIMPYGVRQCAQRINTEWPRAKVWDLQADYHQGLRGSKALGIFHQGQLILAPVVAYPVWNVVRLDNHSETGS